MPLDAETRHYLYIWIRRFIFWAVFGYAVPEAAWWLGAPGAVYGLMLNVAGLVLALLAIIFLLQNRAPIARWIAGPPANASGWGRIRRSFAEIWPVLAVLYICGIYLIHALRIEGGFLYVARATTLSLVVIVGAQLLVRSIRELSRRGFAITPQLKAQFPALEQRANRYLPILTGLASGAVYLLAALTVLQAWNIRAFAWIESGFRPTGHRKPAVDRHRTGRRHRRSGDGRRRDRAHLEGDRRERPAAPDPGSHIAAAASHGNPA